MKNNLKYLSYNPRVIHISQSIKADIMFFNNVIRDKFINAKRNNKSLILNVKKIYSARYYNNADLPIAVRHN